MKLFVKLCQIPTYRLVVKQRLMFLTENLHLLEGNAWLQVDARVAKKSV